MHGGREREAVRRGRERVRRGRGGSTGENGSSREGVFLSIHVRL